MNIERLLKIYPIISDQVTAKGLQVILNALTRTLDAGIEGAVTEFGCYSGTTSLFIRRVLDGYHDTRAFHVYDSFEGLPDKRRQDLSAAGVDFKAGELAISKQQFLRNFQHAHLAPPITHKKWFNELTDQDLPGQICFAFLDGDFYDSIRESLELVWPRMHAGGMVLIDDYNRETLPGVARAVADFQNTHRSFVPARIETNIAVFMC
jgi:O-methyltransferase